jgi:LacI family transcriptional regulator
MAVTLKDVARLANVHPSTVARVLNGDPRQRVSAEVRERIMSVARERGYHPNQLARALRLKRAHVIGTVIPDIANPFFAALLRGIEDAAAQQDFSVILANTDDDPVRELRSLHVLRERQVDGVILATARRHDPAVRQLAETGYPFVLVNRHTEPLPANAVVPDDYAGAMRAVEHLVALGHRRIAHIAGPEALSTGYRRRLGYQAALEQQGLPLDPALVVTGSYREAGGYEAMSALLAPAQPPTAVFAVNDLAALGAVRALYEVGLRVPDDMSLVGFNDLPVAAQMTPRLTTLHVATHLMGVAAAERLLALLSGVDVAVEPLVMPVELVYRDSTARPVSAVARARRSPSAAR